MPFGWDDVADPKTLGEVAVASFNQVGFITYLYRDGNLFVFV